MQGDEVNRLKLQFLASLNHEIRTPLTGIIGMTDLLLETNLDEEQREYADSARSCAQSLFDILNATLEYTSMAAGHMQLDQSEFPLRDILEETASRYRINAEAKDIGLRLLLDSSVPEAVIGDSMRLQQLLSYLLSNAVKFTHEGTVTIDAAAEKVEGETVWMFINIIDTGIGIKEENKQLIFESFQQLETGLSRSYAGLGLGLALARCLVNLMGGTLEFESNYGEGSQFWVRIPFQLPAVQPQRKHHTAESRYQILVVEDNKVARDVVDHVLKQRPYKVDFAVCGEKAIEAAASTYYDLILMDLQMPGMDGLEATDEIRKLPDYENVPILAFTANASAEYRQICRERGMQGFLGKPIQADEVLRTLDRILSTNGYHPPQTGGSGSY